MTDFKPEVLDQFVAAQSQRGFRAILEKANKGSTRHREVNILNGLLALESLEASFYGKYLRRTDGLTATDLGTAKVLTGLPGPFRWGLITLFQQIREHESACVTTLENAIRDAGGAQAKPCIYTFLTTDINDFLNTAQLIENRVVAAYRQAIQKLTNPVFIETCTTIASQKAKQADFLNLVAGGSLSSSNPSAAGSGSIQGGGTATGAVLLPAFPSTIN